MSRNLLPGTPAEVLAYARTLLADSQVISAELALRPLVERHPDCIDAWLMLADIAEQRGDEARTRECIAQATAHAPQNESLGLHIAQLQLRAGNLLDAIDTLIGLIEGLPKSFMAWFMLGDAFALAGRAELALRARYQGLSRGQDAGFLMGMSSTPAPLQPVIKQLIAEINEQHSLLINDGLERMRNLVGPAEMKRVEHAIAVYMGQRQDAPTNANQAPKFLFFPGLPEGPYHDPYLHPWAARLDEAFGDIRAEAIDVLQQEDGLENFLSFKPGQSKAGYLGGEGRNPSWDAFFFYRHGELYDANHARCPKTSAALRGIELCEVAGQAPEICFSVLQPGTHIMPHHGVTNTRLVMHLPLIVPPSCALNVFGGGEHAWREGELMMFDDTFKHEAWNKSDQTRVILLMDCWNPYLTSAERVATRHLVELISDFENFPDTALRQIASQIRAQT